MAYLGLIIGYLIIVLTPVIGNWQKILPRVDKPSWAAYVPFYNYYVALRASNQPWYWVIFLLMPGIQFIMWASINVSFIRKFGVFDVKNTILGILFPFPVFWQIAKNSEKFLPVPPTNWDIEKQVNVRTPSDHVALFFALPVIGHALVIPFSLITKKKPGKKTIFKEWGDAILFALIAASAIRTYVFEPYTIPTGSMEKTMLVGDYLFVEKITFGPRVPMTPFSYPVVHNSFAPLINVKSYLNFQKIPYTRLPGLRFVERNDVTVFNFPAGDTALNDARMPNGLIGHTYEQILRDEAYYLAMREGKSLSDFEANIEHYKKLARNGFEKGKVFSSQPYPEDRERGYTIINGVLSRPVDKRENYIKRCVAIHGDLVEVRNKELFINNELAFQPENMQYNYSRIGVRHPGTFGREDWEWTQGDDNFYRENFNESALNLNVDDSGYVTIALSKSKYAEVKKKFPELVPYYKPKGYYLKKLAEGRSNGYLPIFPNDNQYDWTEDNFGPLKIPSRGDVVKLDHKTLPIYRRIITAYEHHTLSETSEGIFIDGKKVDTYTIEMNYYWLMGDNRNNSADSRFWGFVPEDHIVGRSAFIWMSVNEKGMFGGGVRWERVFSGIK